MLRFPALGLLAFVALSGCGRAVVGGGAAANGGAVVNGSAAADGGAVVNGAAVADDGEPHAAALIPSPPASSTSMKEVCVVLSVGAEQGLAHIGVLTALRERGVRVSCVVGNSMGALVGGLYAAKPGKDLAVQYQELFNAYEAKSHQDAGPFGVSALLGFNRQDWTRLRSVLRTTFDGQRIENLNIHFATEHQMATHTGMRMESVLGGLLADEVASSIANPLLFTDLKLETGHPFDPGSDRISATPLHAACKAFPDKQFIVSNVSGSAIWADGVACPYHEVTPAPVDVDAGLALRGKDPHLRRLIAEGVRAANTAIDWSALPSAREDAPKILPLEFVEVTIEFTLAKTMADGSTWDGPGGGNPDPRLETQVQACEGCDTYGTSARAGFIDERSDTYSLQQNLGPVAVRRGFTFALNLVEQDLSDDDPIGSTVVTYDGPGTKTVNSIAGVELSVTFKILTF